MLAELLAGRKDTAAIAELAKGRLRKKIPELQKALEGHLKPHHKVLISQIMAHIYYLDEAIAGLDAEIEEQMRPFAEIQEQLDEIPGVDKRAAQVIVAEIGVNMDRFPTSGHVASCAGMRPGNNEPAKELERIGDLKGAPHTKACCELIAHPTLGRFVKTDKRGQPRIDREKVKQEERLDGKYLIRTTDDTLSAEDVALGYKQLYEVEDAFRTLKSTLDIRPIYHRLEDRIRAHIVLCWLALLLVRVASIRTGETWAKLRSLLETEVHWKEMTRHLFCALF